MPPSSARANAPGPHEVLDQGRRQGRLPSHPDPGNKDPVLARKFLYFVAAAIVLVIAAAIAFRLWGDKLMRMAMVPGAAFVELTPRSPSDYAGNRLWYHRGETGALPPPSGAEATEARAPAQQAAIFFAHPTSYMDRAAWNAPEADAEAEALAKAFIATEANIFAGLGPLWTPRYRQATFGAFLTDKPEAAKAFDAAYGDVEAAFDAFVQAYPEGPIILAGHSQGSRHLMHLLAARVAGKPVAKRIVAAYLVGWPVSVMADLPALGMPPCAAPSQSGCVLSWQSFAEPAETGAVRHVYDASRGLTGAARRGTSMLCVNPLTGATGTRPAPADANLGMARVDQESKDQVMLRPGIGARCTAEGFLLLSSAPDLGAYVLPGNNYHVYDYALFWANVRADAKRRLDAFLTR